jgi:carboxyl-terminal processing protease
MDHQQTYSQVSSDVQKISHQNNNAAKILLYILGAALFFIIGLLTSAYILPTVNSNGNNVLQNNTSTNSASEVNFDINDSRFTSILNVLKSRYVESNLDSNKLYEGAIKGMVDSLGDPYTAYFTKSETDEYNQALSGKFEGIGAELGYLDGWIIVKRVLENAPAEKYGLKAGEYIGKIDDYQVKKNDSITDIVMKIRGVGGTSVKLTLYQSPQGDGERELNIVRGSISTKSMEFFDEGDGVWRIVLSRFTDSSLYEFVNNWQTLSRDLAAKKPKKIILDLRGNGGGYLDGAVYVAEEFLPKGSTVLHVANRDGIQKTYTVDRNGLFVDTPLLVLQNESSASASEILIGALKGNSKGKFLGTHTFGKGIAQAILSDPAWNGATLHITIEKWLLPDKTQINKENTLKPDIELSPTIEDIRSGKDVILDKAKEIVKDL